LVLRRRQFQHAKKLFRRRHVLTGGSRCGWRNFLRQDKGSKHKQRYG
jgi:hypothetical protein